MKKLALATFLAISFACSAVADSIVTSFLANGISGICVSNAVLGLTNIDSVASVGGVGWGTNIVNTCYTNASGTRIICTNADAAATTGISMVNSDKTSLIQDVDNPLVHFAEFIPYADGNSSVTNASAYRILIKIHGVAAAANSAVTFQFVPLPDGENEGTPAYNIAVTASGTSYVIADTKIPVGIFGSAKKIRLRSVINGDTDANSNVYIDTCKLCGISP